MKQLCFYHGNEEWNWGESSELDFSEFSLAVVHWSIEGFPVEDPFFTEVLTKLRQKLDSC